MLLLLLLSGVLHRLLALSHDGALDLTAVGGIAGLRTVAMIDAETIFADSGLADLGAKEIAAVGFELALGSLGDTPEADFFRAREKERGDDEEG